MNSPSGSETVDKLTALKRKILKKEITPVDIMLILNGGKIVIPSENIGEIYPDSSGNFVELRIVIRREDLWELKLPARDKNGKAIFLTNLDE